MTYPQRLLTDDETIVREFHPHWRVLLVAGLWLVVALAGVIVALSALDGVWMWLLLGVSVLLALVFGVPPFVRWRFKLYVLTTERVIVRDGIISRGGIEIPLENINNVIFTQRLIERLLGYGDVLIESAGTQGQSRLTDIPDPEMFQSEVYRVRENRSMNLNRGRDGGGSPNGGGDSSTDPVARLETLADLHERGALSDAEFEEKKRKLLEDI